MTTLAPLMSLLEDVPDLRRAEGKLYKLPHVLLFSIVAIVSDCNSYRGIASQVCVGRFSFAVPTSSRSAARAAPT